MVSSDPCDVLFGDEHTNKRLSHCCGAAENRPVPRLWHVFWVFLIASSFKYQHDHLCVPAARILGNIQDREPTHHHPPLVDLSGSEAAAAATSVALPAVKLRVPASLLPLLPSLCPPPPPPLFHRPSLLLLWSPLNGLVVQGLGSITAGCCSGVAAVADTQPQRQRSS